MTVWPLAVIMALAAILRFTHADWDGGYQLHPDERAILFVAQDIREPSTLSEALDPDLSPISPYRNSDGSVRSFPYGHFPLYVTVAAQRLLTRVCAGNGLCMRINPDTFTGRLFNSAGLSVFDHLTFIGRAVSALLDTLTVLVTCLLGLELFGSRSAALLSSALLALTVLHIQNSHFGTVDTPLAFMCTVSIWLLVRYASSHSARDSILAGAAIGLAVGCKTTGILLAIPLLIAHLQFGDQRTASRDIHLPGLRAPHVLGLTTLVLVGAFALTNPFAILDPGSFLADQSTQMAIALGAIEPPFMLQYSGTWPVWYSIGQLNRWALGLPLALAAYASLVWGIRQTVLRRARPMLVVMSWVVIGWIVLSSGAAKFPRYLMPVMPSLIVLAGGLLTIPHKATPMLKGAVTVVLLLCAALYAAAFTNMYQSPHPWIAASRWIYAHIPSGSTLIAEANDDALPLDLAARDGYFVRDSIYQTRLVDPLAEPDDCAKIGKLAATLAQADYMVIASNRLYGVVPRLKTRYPLTTAYYNKLLSGDLGYTLERTWARYPNLFGWRITDSTFTDLVPLALPDSEPQPAIFDLGPTDESFTVYDHPLVLLFQNHLNLGSERLGQIILENGSCWAQ